MSFYRTSILEKNLSWKYGLSYDLNNNILVLKIHKAVIEYLLKELSDRNKCYNETKKKIIRSTMRGLCNPRDGIFGFENLFFLKEVNENFVVFEIPINELRDKEIHWGYDSFVGISTTFSVLTEMLQYCDVNTFCAKNQDINLITCAHQSNDCTYFNGEFGIEITNWSKSGGIRNTALIEIQSTVCKAYEIISGCEINDDEKKSFNICTGPNGGFNITIPGRNCNLSSYDLKENNGHPFDSSNVYSAQQQLLLLIVVAMICDTYESHSKATP